ncbi:carbonic anhydrase family protein [Escherichia coli]|nr:carbonic anhydrase family protein [Escherichia coli]
MKVRFLLALVSTLMLSFSSGATEENNWGYNGKEGPEYWGKLSSDFELCESGKNQSPINIKNAKKVYDKSKLLLAFQTQKQTITNNGHTIKIDVSDGNRLLIGNKIFTLQQFHFHSPSENEIDGKHFPLEGHFVFKAQNNSLAVLSLMFQKKGGDNQQLENAWIQIPSVIGHAEELKRPVDINKLLPKDLAYYRFNGSLTTPPCTEGVVWIVLKNPSTISDKQIRKFHSAIPYANNRPIQPLNARIIIQ